jgi:hypothetical protein
MPRPSSGELEFAHSYVHLSAAVSLHFSTLLTIIHLPVVLDSGLAPSVDVGVFKLTISTVSGYEG